MCINFYLYSPTNIDQKTISEYEKRCSIAVQDISTYVKSKSDMNFYAIHRNCACEIFHSNIDEIKELFKIVYKNSYFKFVITDLDGELEDIMSVFKDLKITIDEFLEIYPNQLLINELYEVY